MLFLDDIMCVVWCFILFFFFIGLKYFELYGKYIWKIEKYLEINKFEFCSDVFDVGGYKWYIIFFFFLYL